jgi:Flp pilus assembly protein TadG
MKHGNTSREGSCRMAPLAIGTAFIRRFRTAEEGATLVEVALVSSILFAMVFGIIMISLALYTYDFVGDAARIGARYAMVRGAYCTGFSDCNATQTDIQNYLRGIAYPGIDPTKINVTADWYSVNQVGGAATTVTFCATGTPGTCNVPVPAHAVRVTVTYAMPISIPYWRATTISMSARSQMVISQ